ncbi:MAG: trehalose-phosphatase [Phycisphaerales bacterium]
MNVQTAELVARLADVAETPVLLVACDYDGTLAPIMADPAAATPDASALAALRDLAALDHTHAAIVSGRAMDDLRQFVGDHGQMLLVGMHGGEYGSERLRLSAGPAALLSRIESELHRAIGDLPGFLLEHKPGGVALHSRNADPLVARAVVGAAVNALAPVDGVSLQHGHEVVEFMVIDVDKGRALRRARHECGATAVAFIGDDRTDEDAFRALEPRDLAIRVGEGETVATFRLDAVPAVAQVLRELGNRRRAWLASRKLTPLDRCAILSDQRTVAVVAPGARLCWLCLPRLDSSALFAELVGGAQAGSFEIGPAGGGAPTSIEYEGDSFTLVTRWPALRVVDLLDCSGGRAFQKPGRSDLLRRIEGDGDAAIRFAPRLDFGRVATKLRVRPEGVEVEGSPDPIVLFAPGIAWTIVDEGQHQTAIATIEGKRLPVELELRYGSASMRAATAEPSDRREENRRFWSGWARSLRLPGAAAEQVRRSALVLKALCHGPTGAFAAAATTSLPEHLGGQRNWDYRFCWPRDGALAAAALMRLGNTGHALKFLDWMLDVVDRHESPERLRPIYTLAGGELPPEADLNDLAGYGGSRPVRVGNAAANQVQLDVFGPIVDLAAMLAERGAPIAPDHWRLVRAMVRAVEARWTEPDHGIWEMRTERRHHVHSKVMCWHTIDRALVVEEAVYGTRSADWSRLRDAIRDDVLRNGYSKTAGAFTGSYGSDHLDAAVLMIGLTGLVARDDRRWIDTVGAIERGLRDGPTVRRYRIEDGLPGGEGGLHVCTGWLIESLLTIGRTAEAKALFDEFVGLVRAPGILTEEFDASTAMALGNLPQAYSHLALINAAVAVASAP